MFKLKNIKRGFYLILSSVIAVALVGCTSDTKQTYNDESSSEYESSSVSEVSSQASSEQSVIETSDVSSPKSSNTIVSSNKSSAVISSSMAEKAVSSESSKSQSSTAPLQTVKITFPEGSTVARIFDMIDAKGVANKEELFSAMETMDFSSYPMISAISPKSSERCFVLEGYLYTSTYEFYIDESPENVLKRFLEQSEKRIKSDYRKRAEDLGYTIDDMIILASILEKEVHKQSELATVSSIFHNRLNEGQKLQSDATIKYVEGAIKPYISGDINRYNSFYNTYKCKALPAGAICNPSIKALEAALYPSQTDYIYFATDSDGNYYYSVTYEEHQAVVEMIKQ